MIGNLDSKNRAETFIYDRGLIIRERLRVFPSAATTHGS